MENLFDAITFRKEVPTCSTEMQFDKVAFRRNGSLDKVSFDNVSSKGGHHVVFFSFFVSFFLSNVLIRNVQTSPFLIESSCLPVS